MWRKSGAILLCVCCALCVLYAEPTAATGQLLDEIMSEVQNIREESNLLKIQLVLSEKESQRLKAQLLMLDGKLEKAALSLDKSEAELVQSKKEVEKLKSELHTLKMLVSELSRRSKRLERANNILIGVAVTCALGALGAGIYAGVLR